jgi:ComF family protein
MIQYVIRREWLNIINGFLSILFPTQCAGCKRYIKDFKYVYVCPACYEGLRLLPQRICPACAKPIQSEHADGCRECKERGNEFSYVLAAGVYEGALKEMIHYMKFNNKKSAAKVAAGLIMERVDHKIFTGADMIVPAPLSRGSAAERGYNQTYEVAKVLSAQTGIPLAQSVRKIRETLPQNKLDRKERLKNLKGAFEVKDDVSGKTVVVVDDVFTTGATINEIARTLKKASAKEVRGLVIARSI